MNRFSWKESGGRTNTTNWGGASTARRGEKSWRGSRGSHGSSGSISSPLQSLWEGLPSTNLLCEISLNEIVSSISSKEVTPTIQDSEILASYSWLDRAQATILIPGEPPAWTPPPTTSTLEPDSGTYFRDPNAARYSRYPMEPAIRAVFVMRPHFNTTTIDVVGCGSTMGNLFRFAGSKESTFRFNMQVIGDTIFLVRKENSPREVIDGVYGYGHTFPEKYTTWAPAVKGSVSSQRLVKYNFSGLTCLVRFESDGYLKDRALGDEESSDKDLFAQPKLLKSPQGPDASTLLSKFGSATVSDKVPDKHSRELTIELGGRLIPQHAVFDLKTRSGRSARSIDMNEVLPRLWVSQIPNFIIGYHQSGKFDDVRITNVRADIKEWEQENADILRRFHGTLQQLISIAKQSDCRKFELRRIGQGPLKIWKLREGSWRALPHDLRMKWSGKETDEGKDSDDSGSGTRNQAGGAADSDDEEDPDDYLKF